MSTLGVVVTMMVHSQASRGDPPAPQTGSEFTLESTTGGERHLRDFPGRVVVIVYEDRDGSADNDALKQDLARRAADRGLSAQVTLLPVADLRGYAFWPAQGYARDAVIDIASRLGVEILIDWNGSMGTAYRMTRGRSNVLILDRERRVVYRHTGALGVAERAQFFVVLERAIAAPTPTSPAH